MDKKQLAFILSLVGGILILVEGAAVAAMGSILGAMLGGMGMGFGLIAAEMIALLGGVGIVLGIVMIFGGLQLKKSSGKMWPILVIILSVVAFFMVSGGFIAGTVLGVIAGILALMGGGGGQQAAPAAAQSAPKEQPAAQPQPNQPAQGGA